MVYIALLRGVNVGGKSMVSMATLKTCFENLGLDKVKTYINSGNVIFQCDHTNAQQLTKQIETTIEQQLGQTIQVLLKTHGELHALVAGIPATWKNDTATKCDVMFLWPAVDKPETLSELPINPAIDSVRYEPGAIIWCVDRVNAAKSRMTRIVGTPLYKQMTVRNPNTVRKLLALADELA